MRDKNFTYQTTACTSPFIIKRKIFHNAYETDSTVPVPCGHCPGCYKRRASGWSHRLYHTHLVSSTAYFVTLTYDPESIHLKRTKNGLLSLDKNSLQLYIKRLRQAHIRNYRRTGLENYNKHISYYAVGEYGTKHQRPHWHLLIFNADMELIKESWNETRYTLLTKRGNTFRNHSAVRYIWKNLSYYTGSVHIGTVTPASTSYCLKYISKPSKIPCFKNDDRQKEKAYMSKGLGLAYLTPEVIRWHNTDMDNRMFATTFDNKKLGLPRYYKNRIYGEVQYQELPNGLFTTLKWETDTVKRRSVSYKARYQMLLREQKKQRPANYEYRVQQAVMQSYRTMYQNFNNHKTIF